MYTVDFPTTDDFLDIFRHDLERWLHDPAHPWNAKNTIQSEQPLKSTTAIQETPYLQTWVKLLATECAHLPLEILDARHGLEQADLIGLPDIFVPLKATAPTETWKETREPDLALAIAMAAGGKQESVPVLELMKE